MSVVFLTLLLLVADDKPSASATEESRRQQETSVLAAAKARQVEILFGTEPQPVKASLRKEPLLRWSNPTAGSVYGEVFLWSVESRPIAVASIYRWYHPYKDATLEIVSLTDKTIEAREGAAVIWKPQSSGITFKEFPDAPPPAAAAGSRLNQMRSLTRRFAAQLADKRAGETVSRELRLLNQPVHRYESPKQGVIDGAMFAFVEVTDPEAWIILEAVKSEEKTTWRYGLARMNSDALEIRLADKVVASWSKVAQPWKDRQAPYTLFSFDPTLVPLEKTKEAAP